MGQLPGRERLPHAMFGRAPAGDLGGVCQNIFSIVLCRFLGINILEIL